MKKILIIVGTRPEAIKLIPVFLALQNRYDVHLISTGQHKDLMQPIFNFFGVEPRLTLEVMTSNQTLAEVTSRLFLELHKILQLAKADLVVVQGDTTTAMVAAMVSYYCQTPVAHVEAGLRSGNKYAPFPEEINRSIISLVAQLNFAPTKRAAENLRGHPNVHMVGNTIIDSLYLTLKKISNRNEYDERLGHMIKKNKDLILVTAHRRESFGEGIANISRAVRMLAEKHPSLQFIFLLHPNPNVKEKITAMLGNIPSISLIEPVGYDDMIFLMGKARIILTDSGGIQEEAPSLRIPLVVMRDQTERPEGIEAGCAVLAGTKTEGIVSAFEKVFSDPGVYEAMKNAGNPYGDGKSAGRIASVIGNFL